MLMDTRIRPFAAGLLIAVAIAFVVPQTGSAATGPQTGTAATTSAKCVPGVWDLKTHNAGSASPVTATSTRYCLFDGRVEMAEYRSFGADGRLNFAGISFHAWEDDGRGLTTLWLMIGDPGYTILPTRVDSVGRLVADGFGEDAGGKFLERSLTTISDNNNYRFEMERSPDNGKTWRPTANIDGTYRTSELPPLPDTLREPMRAVRDARGESPTADASGSTIIVLDGLAEVRLSTSDRDGKTLNTIVFASAYGQAPGTWRQVVWQTGETTITVE